MVTIHAHEGTTDRLVPAQFLVSFAHAMVDAGADLFVGHGPHVLRGVEIYKGKPIFYSMSNFIFQNETVLRMPQDGYEEYSLSDDAQMADYLDARYDKDRRSFPADREYWDSMVAMTKWDGGKFVSAELHPIVLGFQQPRSQRGRPKLATGADAARILDMMTARSKAFGATVTVKGGVGFISPP